MSWQSFRGSVSGARRVRELRVEFGWWIYSGYTFADIAAAAENAGDQAELAGVEAMHIRPDQYILMRTDEDRDAAYRWNVLNEIRGKKVSVTEKLLEYFRRNVGKQITGEELKYLASDAKEWARRVRELRTEAGWPIVTRNSGRGRSCSRRIRSRRRPPSRGTRSANSRRRSCRCPQA